MKTQVVSILLSALLCSTLAHEYLQARHLTQSHSKRLQHFGKHHANRADDNSNQVCSVECTAPQISGDLEFHLSVDVNIAAVVNTTANLALLIDVSANIVVLLNGNTGAAVAVDIATGAGVTIAGGIWLAANAGFAAYFATLTSLKVILAVAGAVSFTLKTITSAQLALVLTVIQGLVGSLQLQAKEALTFVLQLAKQLAGALKVIAGVLVAGAFAVRGSILVLANILVGIQTLMASVAGGVAALVAAHIKLDLAILLSGISALQVLASILVSISAGLSLSVVTVSAESLIVVVSLLGGGVIDGSINGVLNVLGSIVLLSQGKITINGFINVLIGVAINIHQSFDDQIKADLELLLEFSEVVGLTAIVQGLIAGSLKIAGVVVGKVLAALQAGASAALTVVVGVLVAINAVVSIESSVVTLLIHLIGLITTRVGALLVGQLLNISVGVNVIAQIAGALNLSLLAQLVINFNAAIQKIPIIGAIYAAVQAAVSGQGISVNFGAAIAGVLKAFLGVVLSGGDILGSALSQAANTGVVQVQAGASFSFSASISASASASGSGSGSGSVSG